MTVGNMNPRSLFKLDAPVVVVQSVPCCVIVGVVVSVPISYHLAPTRRVFPLVDAAHAVVTSTEWAVHSEVTPVSLFLRMEAANNLTSETSIAVVEPEARCAVMLVVVTARVTFAPRVGVPPGVETLRILILLKKPASVPMM
jgi:hypothetical protein